jgi:tetratricopeptide (TPR) repeat protein
MSKAAKLFDEALRDRRDGNLVSARMNMKLALTFDPSNPLYQQSFEELSRVAPSGNSTSRAREFYDAATVAEREGRIDEAIDFLERALKESKEPAVYNRLGVLLAMKKGEYVRAQQLVETALALSPGNATYDHNLGKILQMAAVSAHGKDKEDKKAGNSGVLSKLFGKKK